MAKQEMATTKYRLEEPGVERRVILLVAPVHDALTEYTAELLADPPDLGAPNVLCRPVHPVTYDEQLSRLSIDPAATEVCLIFCGHGRAGSLDVPGASGGGGALSPFFDYRHVPAGPKFLLAFCSNSGAWLGGAYERNTRGRTFVGFDGEIGFVAAGGAYAYTWRKILFGIAAAMLSAADDNFALEKSVVGLYRDALSMFSPENDPKHRWGLAMRMYLRQQMKAVSCIRT
ncbi:MAG: hypothetical protein LC795_07870 [Acidobacteria bacterium]|nr:hypothetical protein [Acidobacteriota bacterium]